MLLWGQIPTSHLQTELNTDVRQRQMWRLGHFMKLELKTQTSVGNQGHIWTFKPLNKTLFQYMFQFYKTGGTRRQVNKNNNQTWTCWLSQQENNDPAGWNTLKAATEDLKIREDETREENSARERDDLVVLCWVTFFRLHFSGDWEKVRDTTTGSFLRLAQLLSHILDVKTRFINTFVSSE